MNYVSWGDAARFANWLTNGQPTGPQGPLTTEDGSYYLNGATSNEALAAVTRKANARYVIPDGNEWYKTAYYDPAKSGGAGYWEMPTRSNEWPSNVLSSSGTNNANHNAGTLSNPSYTLGAPYYRTEVGAFASSPSGYGTFDQGGNVWEWSESWASSDGMRHLYGGSYDDSSGGLSALGAWNFGQYSSVERSNVGFRIAYVPEPATMVLLTLLGTMALDGRKPRRR